MRHCRRIAAAMLLCFATRAIASDFYVAPAGDDAATGTKDHPWQTLAAAQKAVRASKAKGLEPITIWCDRGTYSLRDPLVFTPEDSGTAAAPITYAATAGGPVASPTASILSGGTKLTDLHWQPYKNNILKTAVPPGTETDQLFVNGQRQILARYPNFDPNQRILNGYAADAVSPARAALWSDPTGGFIHAMHRNNWGGLDYQITGKDAQGNVTYIGGWQTNRAAGMHRQYRMVEGIFEELDAPGEWFLNSKENTLYFYPPTGMTLADLEKASVETVRLRELIELKGSESAAVHDISFKGFTFRHTARTFMENKEPLLMSDWTIYRGAAVMFNGSQDCSLNDCFLDQLGGNSVFVNNFNRRVTISGCQITNAGASGIAFVGDTEAVRNPIGWSQQPDYAAMDRTPGPKTNNFPADCLVDDCLITLTGRVEKQSAPVEISMSQSITIRHCSIYDVPRAGINIGDGCWGGHIVEFCDVFDTVKETGDHGSFNSWGRDRFWNQSEKIINAEVAKDPALPLLDVVKPITLRNTRWRCDHGWDIDLDDGSSNYIIENNLCLGGGIKFREGYQRDGENNVIPHNSFHPHVWLNNSGDIFAHNIVATPYKPINMPKIWGKEVDYNFLAGPRKLPDQHTASGDPMFIDPDHGDFGVKENSPALALGFKNFPMDRFGVTSPALKAIARIPSFAAPAPAGVAIDNRSHDWQGAKVKNITTLGEQSVAALPAIAGVLLEDVPDDSAAAKAGLQKGDVIIECNDKPVASFPDLQKLLPTAATDKADTLGIVRGGRPRTITTETLRH